MFIVCFSGFNAAEVEVAQAFPDMQAGYDGSLRSGTARG
jgi:hypothetical protein